jgi:hypothetical protein
VVSLSLYMSITWNISSTDRRFDDQHGAGHPRGGRASEGARERCCSHGRPSFAVELFRAEDRTEPLGFVDGRRVLAVVVGRT